MHYIDEITTGDEENEKIYTDFDFDEMFVEPDSVPISALKPVNEGQTWGNHTQKPPKQTKWEATVKEEIERIAEHDLYPYINMPISACQSTEDPIYLTQNQNCGNW